MSVQKVVKNLNKSSRLLEKSLHMIKQLRNIPIEDKHKLKGSYLKFNMTSNEVFFYMNQVKVKE